VWKVFHYFHKLFSGSAQQPEVCCPLASSSHFSCPNENEPPHPLVGQSSPLSQPLPPPARVLGECVQRYRYAVWWRGPIQKYVVLTALRGCAFFPPNDLMIRVWIEALFLFLLLLWSLIACLRTELWVICSCFRWHFAVHDFSATLLGGSTQAMSDFKGQVTPLETFRKSQTAP